MRLRPSLLALTALTALLASACTHHPINRLVGADRDEHGCLGSAGYTWSDALHQCVRLWETGERITAGSRCAFLLFSADSTYTEIFTNEGKILLRRDKTTPHIWTDKKANNKVVINNGATVVRAYNVTYTQVTQ